MYNSVDPSYQAPPHTSTDGPPNLLCSWIQQSRNYSFFCRQTCLLPSLKSTQNFVSSVNRTEQSLANVMFWWSFEKVSLSLLCSGVNGGRTVGLRAQILAAGSLFLTVCSQIWTPARKSALSILADIHKITIFTVCSFPGGPLLARSWTEPVSRYLCHKRLLKHSMANVELTSNVTRNLSSQ